MNLMEIGDGKIRINNLKAHQDILTKVQRVKYHNKMNKTSGMTTPPL